MNKYHNRITVISGIRFDSAKEAEVYQQLRLLERGGKIRDLKLQPPFTLVPEYISADGRRVRDIKYVADFMFYDVDLGRTRVIDVKGMRTDIYMIKKKLFDYKMREKKLYIEETIGLTRVWKARHHPRVEEVS